MVKRGHFGRLWHLEKMLSKKEARKKISENIKKMPNGCWEWKRSRQLSGHGSICFKIGVFRAHRVSYLAFKGEIPKEMCVCHSCDNPPCCNPEHLWLGTKKDNSIDMWKKGRRASFRGIKNGRAKLTEERVLILRENENNMEKLTSLSKDFGIDLATVYNVISRRTWNHIPSLKEIV